MSALGTELVTLLDVSKGKDKAIGSVAEVLVKENAMLKDIPYIVMNEGTIHKESIRSGLPTVYYRKANQAIPASKTTIEERSFTAAHFESKSQMDEMVATRGGPAMLGFNRWNQATGHIQAMGLEHANLAIYGSPADDNRKVAGFMDIFSTVNTAAEETANQVIDAGGTGSDNMSILKVHWGLQSVFGVYPAGGMAGLKRTDRSKGGPISFPGLDSNGNTANIWGYEEQFEIDHGLVVKDYRQAARICNIALSALQSGTSAADLIELMIDADHKIHSLENGQGVWYVNRTIQAFLHKQALTKVGAGAGLTFDNYQGERVLMFLGAPVRRMDALLNTEAQVV